MQLGVTVLSIYPDGEDDNFFSPPCRGPSRGSWLRGCRSRVDLGSGPLAPLVPTPPSQSHPEVIPFHSAVGQDCTALTRFSCANLSAITPTWTKLTDTATLPEHGIPVYKERVISNGACCVILQRHLGPTLIVCRRHQ